ncbi:Transcription termination factor 5 [Blattella germanica]|nr:Transcription termination factor 5 [Blattella germanica]
MLNSRFLSSIHFVSGKWCPNFLMHQQIRQKTVHAINKGQMKLMMNVLGISYRKTQKLLTEHLNLRTVDQDLICKSANMLERFGITKEEIYKHPDVLSIQPVTIENHALLLQESGFTSIKVEYLVSYFMMWKKSVRLLKAYNYIPEDTKVCENFFTFLKNPPPPLDFQSSDDHDFLEEYLPALNHFLCWRLEVSQKELDRILQIYPRMRNRSFRLMDKTIEVLQEKVDFSIDKIRRHAYLIYAHPNNILNSLNQVPSLGGVDIKVIFHKYPKIIMSQTDTLLKTAAHIKNFGIPDSAILRCPEIFTLSSETVKERLKALKSVPEFIGLIKHPRVLRLVHHQRKARSRLNYLQEIHFKCASLHLLQSSQKVFDKYVLDGTDRTSGSDILSKQLEKELDGLPTHPELNTEFLNQQAVKTDEIDSESRIQKFTLPQQLALALYFIEREYHFSGDGILFDNTAAVATTDGS